MAVPESTATPKSKRCGCGRRTYKGSAKCSRCSAVCVDCGRRRSYGAQTQRCCLCERRRRSALRPRCVICGSPFTRHTNSNGCIQRACSFACGLVLRKQSNAIRRAELAARREVERSRKTEERKRLSEERRLLRAESYRQMLQRLKAERLVIRLARAERKCPECERLYLPIHGRRKFCSLRCTRKNGKRICKVARRAREHSTERIDPVAVFRRDRWCCQLCGRATPKRLLGTNNDQAPTLDHIVPLCHPSSPGHVWSNVQCAHRGCNTKKHTNIVGQLRLI